MPAPSPRIAFAPLTENNLGTVRKLNSVLFPIKYSEKFYQSIQSPELEDFCKLVYYNDVPVGTVCCRIETEGDDTSLYIMTMGVLAPYRSRGVGSKSLQSVLDAAKAHTKPKISKIFLHVQVNNEDARRFYEKHGFTETGLQKDYYKKIEPHDAWILTREVDASAS
ncbi:acyl-CoA N-acyltransferase [Schizophyllum amplum]|uniref:Acyl-CoA N-acyltransferase n=1 Tax=Schizophyllum amplum TaxID=97359 RepID=A0A550CXB9_9AGAR|nr:acyl-CoA N-acyltransferase [Auriculariopsis ampla]